MHRDYATKVSALWPTAKSIREAIEVLREYSLSNAFNTDEMGQGTYWNGPGVLSTFLERRRVEGIQFARPGVSYSVIWMI